MIDMEITQDQEPLKIADRCDRCGAQAYVRATTIAGDLLWCGHHFHEYEPRLREVSIFIHDERERLTKPQPLTPAS